MAVTHHTLSVAVSTRSRREEEQDLFNHAADGKKTEKVKPRRS